MTSENSTGKLVRVIEGLMDVMDGRHHRDKDFNDGKYIIRAGEFCRCERIENEKIG
jgi:hypothetical protein